MFMHNSKEEVGGWPTNRSDIERSVGVCLENQLTYKKIADYEKYVKVMHSQWTNELLLVLRNDFADWFESVRKLLAQQAREAAGPLSVRKEIPDECHDVRKVIDQQAQNQMGSRHIETRKCETTNDIVDESSDIALFRSNIFLEVDELIKRLKKAHLTIVSYEQMLRDKNDVVECTKNEMKALNERIDMKDKNLDLLHKRIAEKELEISNFHILVERQNEELYSLRAIAETKDKEISTLMKLLELADVKLDERQKNMETMACSVDQLTEHISEIKNIETSQLDAVRSVVESMQTSMSSLIEMREHVKLVSARKTDEESMVKETTMPKPGYLRRLQQLYPKLIEKLSASSVAPELFQKDLLRLGELQKVQCSCTPVEAAEYLLTLLLDMRSEASYDCFMNALKATNQEHIFLWLTYDDYNIDSEHTDLIRRKYTFLLDHLNPTESGLISLLFAERVIDQREKEFLESGDGAVVQAERLLSVLSRKSLKQFERFLTALDQTGLELVVFELRSCQSSMEPSVAGDVPHKDLTIRSKTETKPSSNRKLKERKVVSIKTRNATGTKRHRHHVVVDTARTDAKEHSSLRVFGVPLRSCQPGSIANVPLIVELCTNIIEENGIETVGIYRVACNRDVLGGFIEDLNKDPVTLCPDHDNWQDVKIVSGLLKTFFNSLPDPLITADLCGLAITAIKEEDVEKRVRKLQKILLELPECNFETLKFLAQHLRRVASKAEVNKMDCHSLAIVFGVHLFRLVEKDLFEQYSIVESLISHCDWYFSSWDENVYSRIDEEPLNTITFSAGVDGTENLNTAVEGHEAAAGYSSPYEKGPSSITLKQPSSGNLHPLFALTPAAESSSITMASTITNVIGPSKSLFGKDRKGDVGGLTVYGVELLIVRKKPKGLIEVYYATSFAFKRNIKVKELEGFGNVCGMTLCTTNSCLYCGYCSDGNGYKAQSRTLNGYIVRVELFMDNSAFKWKIQDKVVPQGLSVNGERNVIVACCTKEDYSGKLIEYTTRGQPVRTVVLQRDIERLQHAVQLNSSQFLVVSGSPHRRRRLCLVDADGLVVLEYGNERGSKTGELDEPRQIAVDRFGCIIVADESNDRVVVYDRLTLQWSRDLLVGGGDGVKSPSALYLDEDRGQLFVGERNGDDSRVLVVSVQHGNFVPG